MADKKSESTYTVRGATGHTVTVTGEARRDVFIARGYKNVSAKAETSEPAKAETSEPAKAAKNPA